VMVLVLAVLLVNFVVDLLYVALDPRLRTAS
jgi:peptide/nickel transport system permease protein